MIPRSTRELPPLQLCCNIHGAHARAKLRARTRQTGARARKFWSREVNGLRAASFARVGTCIVIRKFNVNSCNREKVLVFLRWDLSGWWSGMWTRNFVILEKLLKIFLEIQFTEYYKLSIKLLILKALDELHVYYMYWCLSKRIFLYWVGVYSFHSEIFLSSQICLSSVASIVTD